MLVTFGTFRVKQGFLNLQIRRYFSDVFRARSGLGARDTRDGEKRGSRACLGLRACLHSPERRQARLPKCPVWLGHRCG